MDNGLGNFKKEMEELPNIKEWPQSQILVYEKELLGFYLSGHPLARYRIEIKEFTDCSTRDLRQKIDGQEIKMVVLIGTVKLTTTRKTSERMAILKLEDLEGTVEAVIFPSVYPNVATFLQEGDVVFVRGRVNMRDNVPKIVVDDVKPINEIYKAIKAINVDLSGLDKKELRKLRLKLAEYPGNAPVYLRVNTQSYKGVEILVGDDLYVKPDEDLMNELKDLVGEEKFSVNL
jgi:DNA polymerase-3 subunit alpha